MQQRVQSGARPVVLAMQQTLDGFVAGPNGETDWIHPGVSPDLEAFLCEHLEAADTMLMGRVTYEEQAAVWPNLGGRMADAVNGHSKVVFSATATGATWAGTRFTSRSPAQEVADLQHRAGSTIAVSGGPTLVRALLADDLIDAIQLTVHPIALGTGLHGMHGRKRFALTASHRFASGALVNRYVRAAIPQA